MPTYENTQAGDINRTILRQEIDGALSLTSLSLGSDGTTVYVEFAETLDAGQQTTLQSTITNHDPLPYPYILGVLSASAQAHYNAKMKAGFAHNGKTYPLTSETVSNWSTLNQSKDSPEVTYPIPIPTANGTKYYIANSAEVSTMFGLAVSTGSALVASYSEALDAIVTAVDKASAQSAHDTYLAS